MVLQDENCRKEDSDACGGGDDDGCKPTGDEPFKFQRIKELTLGISVFL